MIKYIIVILASANMLMSQTGTDIQKSDLEIGAILKIGRPMVNTYKYIDFPRANFIIKKGGIANYKIVEGNQVIVTAIKENKDGTKKVRLQPVDGSRFFGTHKTVSADLREAIQSGELLTD